MNVNEKDQFVQRILHDLKHEILRRVPKFPEEWDGHEIRQFISDYYNEHYAKYMLQGKRLKEYKNICLINNLT